MLKKDRKRWVEEYLCNGNKKHDDRWIKSIAVGNIGFIERLNSMMGTVAIGRKSNKAGGSYQLREPAGLYNTHFESKKDDIDLINSYS